MESARPSYEGRVTEFESYVAEMERGNTAVQTGKRYQTMGTFATRHRSRVCTTQFSDRIHRSSHRGLNVSQRSFFKPVGHLKFVSVICGYRNPYNPTLVQHLKCVLRTQFTRVLLNNILQSDASSRCIPASPNRRKRLSFRC